MLSNTQDADTFGDQSFRQGLAQRSAYLGDPVDSKHAGHPSKWLVGGPDNEADILVIVASDSPILLEETCAQINKQAGNAGLNLICHQKGETLPGDLRGHEHFGFKDGVSMPGVRGKLSTAPGDYITPRYYDNKDERRLFFAKPGQLLAWPGQFLLGEQRQNPDHLYHPALPAASFPKWAAKGAYLVVRRLRQDVLAFWSFVSNAATRLGLPAEKVAAMLIGRWPSGAPIMRVPDADNGALGDDTFANNHFIFDDNTRPSNLEPIPGYTGDNFPQGRADFLATVCPHFAHIRKVNPRDSATDLGKPEDNLARLILRRGIPFGAPIVGVKNPGKELLEAERGLMFLSYGSSIEAQFEFIQRRWANVPVQPNMGGYDTIIGQNGGSPDRKRFIDFPTAKGPVRLSFSEEWVTPTGGGYFFAPTISAIRNGLAE
jgi:Dyp-type peroxidase family